MNSDYKLTISSARFVRSIKVVSIIIIVSSIIGELLLYFVPDFFLRDSFIELFNLNGERNFPALFSGILLLICSFLLLCISRLKKRECDRDDAYWLGLGIIFLYLGIDEICSLHERAIYPLHKLGFDSGFLYYSWIIIAIPIVFFIGLIFLNFLLRLPKPTRDGFLLAALIYIGGAIFMESISGFSADRYGTESLIYVSAMTVEETLEIVGVLIFINAILDYIVSIKVESIRIKLLIKR